MKKNLMSKAMERALKDRRIRLATLREDNLEDLLEKVMLKVMKGDKENTKDAMNNFIVVEDRRIGDNSELLVGTAKRPMNMIFVNTNISDELFMEHAEYLLTMMKHDFGFSQIAERFAHPFAC